MKRIFEIADEMGITLDDRLLEYVGQAFEYYKGSWRSEDELIRALLTEAEIRAYERREERGQ